ncbi:MAG: TetR/AcrR family transcriptional regulator [Candidatus Binatia bacterium]
MSTSATSVTPRRLAARVGALPSGASTKGTRGRVLDAALRLFAERGFGVTSIRDIAREAKVNSATLYSHYPSKEHVLAELIDLGHEEYRRRFRKALLESQPDPREQLATFVRTHVRMHAEFSMLAVVANAELHLLSDPLGSRSRFIREELSGLFVDIVRRGVELGVFKTPDAWLAAAAIGGMGLRVAEWYRPESGYDIDTVADTYVEFALRIVGAADKTG